jgi:hypothetical protein
MASTSLQVLSEANIALLQQTEGVANKAILQQHYLQSGDQIFIKKAGLLNKLEQKFGKNGTSVYSEIPTEKEYEMIRKMTGMKPDDIVPCAIMKGIVEVIKDGQPTGQKYTSFGTATFYNCNNKGVYPEMAETRAILRAARLATNCGWTSLEEVPETEPGAIITNQTPPPSTITITQTSPTIPQKERATKEQKDLYASLCKDLGFRKDNPGNLNEIVKSVFGRELGSTKNLYKDELQLLINALQKELNEKGKSKEAEEIKDLKENEKENEEAVIEGEVISSEEINDNENNENKEEN